MVPASVSPHVWIIQPLFSTSLHNVVGVEENLNQMDNSLSMGKHMDAGRYSTGKRCASVYLIVIITVEC